MYRFDCMGAKAQAREWIRTVRPRPVIVTLIFLVLTSGISLCVGELLPNPLQESADYLMQGYDPVAVFGRFVGTWAMIAMFVNLLVTFYVTLLNFGYADYSLRLSRRERAGVENLLEGFGLAVKVVLLDILQALFIALWSMLFVIPGVIASYRYSQAVFCLIDDPDISPLEAIRRSKQMMQGHKMELFTVQLSFFGWMLLRLAVSNIMGYLVAGTVGQEHFLVSLTVYLLSDVVNLALMPYMHLTFAQYYNWLIGWAPVSDRELPEGGEVL